jgi:hypothetical protein
MPLPTPTQLTNSEENPILAELRELKKKVAELQRRIGGRTNFANAATTNIVVGTGDPFDIENPFTGTAILYPAFSDATGAYHIFGMNAGVIQWGANSLDGKIYFGGGDGWLDSAGLNFVNQEGAIFFEDSAGNPYDVQISIAGDDYLEFENEVASKGFRFFANDASLNIRSHEITYTGINLASGAAFTINGVNPLYYGWNAVTETWTRTGNHTFTVPSDLTFRYRKGAKVHYSDGGSSEYGVIGSSSHAAGTTTVNLIPNTSYTMAAATITTTLISYIENPESFPHWFNFDAAPTGFSAVSSDADYKWTTKGNTIYIAYVEAADGTSNATTFTASAPIVPILNVTGVAGTLVDNGGLLTTAGRLTMTAGSATITFRTNMNVGAWTNVGGKRAVAYFFYEF